MSVVDNAIEIMCCSACEEAHCNLSCGLPERMRAVIAEAQLEAVERYKKILYGDAGECANSKLRADVYVTALRKAAGGKKC